MRHKRYRPQLFMLVILVSLSSCQSTEFSKYKNLYLSSKPLGVYVITAESLMDSRDKDFEEFVESTTKDYLGRLFSKSSIVFLNDTLLRETAFTKVLGTYNIDERIVGMAASQAGCDYAVILYYTYRKETAKILSNGRKSYEQVDLRSWTLNSTKADIVDKYQVVGSTLAEYRDGLKKLPILSELSDTQLYRAFLVDKIIGEFLSIHILNMYQGEIRASLVNNSGASAF